MRNPIISIFVAFAFVVGGTGLEAVLAQTPSGPSIDHKHADDHHVSGHPDQGYQHSFGHAEMWAKEFDDPARDAWQKPNEVLDVLHLKRTSRVADLGAGTGYFSVRGSPDSCRKENYLPSTSNQTWYGTFASARTAKI